MENDAKKIIKRYTTSTSENGWIRCPRCKRGLARAYFGASCKGIEIKCRCKALVTIDIPVAESREDDLK